MKILLVNENSTLVNAFTKFLQIKGYFVTTEFSLKAGLRRLKKELYDVVFVDAPLEDYDETQILLYLKENKIFQKTNVLLFSHLDFDSAELNKWKNYGLYSYLKKPVKRSVIIKTLDDLYLKTNSDDSQIISEFEQKEEEATSEQLDKVKQLEKQIEELESHPEPITEPEILSSPRGSLPKDSSEDLPQELDLAPEPIPEQKEEETTSEQLDKLKQLEKQIEELRSQPKPVQGFVTQSKPKEEETTSEQLDKLKQLETQIQELERTGYQSIHDEKDLTPKNLSDIKQDSSENISDFQKIIHDLSSLSSRFDSTRRNPTTNVETAQDVEFIKNEMNKTSSEISKLKKEIEYIEELIV